MDCKGIKTKDIWAFSIVRSRPLGADSRRHSDSSNGIIGIFLKAIGSTPG